MVETMGLSTSAPKESWAEAEKARAAWEAAEKAVVEAWEAA